MKSPWLEQLSIAPWGYRIRLRSDRPGAGEAIRDIFLPDWQETLEEEVDRTFSLRVEGPPEEVGLYQDEEKLVGGGSLDFLVSRLSESIHLDIATYAPDTVFVHAGVVRWKDQAVVIPGRSYTGKSTLVQALVEAGATYYSDEYAVFDLDGRVNPYPRAISLRETAEGPQRKPARELGWTPDCGPIPVGMVVVTRFEAEAAWEPTELSPGRTVLALFDNTVSAQIAPERAMQVLPRAVGCALLFEGARGEAPETARRVLDRLQ